MNLFEEASNFLKTNISNVKFQIDANKILVKIVQVKAMDRTEEVYLKIGLNATLIAVQQVNFTNATTEIVDSLTI